MLLFCNRTVSGLDKGVFLDMTRQMERVYENEMGQRVQILFKCNASRHHVSDREEVCNHLPVE